MCTLNHKVHRILNSEIVMAFDFGFEDNGVLLAKFRIDMCTDDCYSVMRNVHYIECIKTKKKGKHFYVEQVTHLAWSNNDTEL